MESFSFVGGVCSWKWQVQYQPRKCGLNSLGFIETLDQMDVPLQGSSLIRIERPRGFPDMVDPLMARNDGRNVRWYFHMITQDQYGMVYDFDFTDEPTPIQFCDYIHQMFLDDRGIGAVDHFYTSPSAKLNDYELTFTDAREVLDAQRGRRNPKPLKKLSLRDAMKECD